MAERFGMHDPDGLIREGRLVYCYPAEPSPVSQSLAPHCGPTAPLSERR